MSQLNLLGQESPAINEWQLIEEMVENNKKRLQKDSQHFSTAIRQQHPKSHGCVEGKLTIESSLPSSLQKGIFQPSQQYDALVRFSNGSSRRDPISGKFPPDQAGDGRGMAIKVLNIKGEKVLVEPQHDQEQDFIGLNTFTPPESTFFVRNVQDYLYFIEITEQMGKGIITFTAGKPHIPPEFQETWSKIKYAFDKLLPVISQPDVRDQLTSPLDISYWSTTPYQLGENQGIKFRFVPRHHLPTFDPKTAVDPHNYLREALVFHLSQEKQEAIFDFEVQLQTDPNTMPIEDPTIEWDEKISPYQKVGTLYIPTQIVKPREFDENLGFSPWHTLSEHRPLGGINRARKRIYTELAKLRREFNQRQ